MPPPTPRAADAAAAAACRKVPGPVLTTVPAAPAAGAAGAIAAVAAAAGAAARGSRDQSGPAGAPPPEPLEPTPPPPPQPPLGAAGAAEPAPAAVPARAARAADGRVAAEDHVVERDLRRGRAARRVVRHEQPAPEPRPAPAAAAARAALGDRVLDRQILDRRRARIGEQAAVGAGAVESRALAVDGQRVIPGEVDRGNVGAFRQRRAGLQRDDVMRAVSAVRLRGEIDRLDVGGKLARARNVEIRWSS